MSKSPTKHKVECGPVESSRRNDNNDNNVESLDIPKLAAVLCQIPELHNYVVALCEESLRLSDPQKKSDKPVELPMPPVTEQSETLSLLWMLLGALKTPTSPTLPNSTSTSTPPALVFLLESLQRQPTKALLTALTKTPSINSLQSELTSLTSQLAASESRSAEAARKSTHIENQAIKVYDQNVELSKRLAEEVADRRERIRLLGPHGCNIPGSDREVNEKVRREERQRALEVEKNRIAMIEREERRKAWERHVVWEQEKERQRIRATMVIQQQEEEERKQRLAAVREASRLRRAGAARGGGGRAATPGRGGGSDSKKHQQNGIFDRDPSRDQESRTEAINGPEPSAASESSRSGRRGRLAWAKFRGERGASIPKG